MSEGQVAPANPHAFKIIDGKLYLAAGKSSVFFQDPEGIAKMASKQWARRDKKH